MINSKTKCTRIDLETSDYLDEISKETGRSVSEIIKYAIYDFIEKDIDIKKNTDVLTGTENSIQLRFNVSKNRDGYKKIVESAKINKRTVAQEIRERLSITLKTNPFKEVDLKQLNKHMADLNRLGNMLKLSLDLELNDKETLEKIRKEIKEISSEIRKEIVNSKRKEL